MDAEIGGTGRRGQLTGKLGLFVGINLPAGGHIFGDTPAHKWGHADLEPPVLLSRLLFCIRRGGAKVA